jgi:hypothetical protein
MRFGEWVILWDIIMIFWLLSSKNVLLEAEMWIEGRLTHQSLLMGPSSIFKQSATLKISQQQLSLKFGVTSLKTPKASSLIMSNYFHFLYQSDGIGGDLSARMKYI